MSPTSSESSGKVKLIAKSGYPTGEVIVRNSLLREEGRGTNSVEMDLAPGLYEVLFQVGNARSEKLIELPAGLTEPFVVLAENLKVDSAALVKSPQGSYSLDSAEDPAVTLSAMPPKPSIGTGAEVFICVREAQGDDPQPFPSPSNPAANLNLFDFADNLVFSCSAAETIGGTCGVVIEIAPGPYLLRLERGTGDPLEQTVYLSEGWRTQIFLPLQMISTSDEELSPNLANASILLTLPGVPFDPDIPENAWVESARQDLASGRAVVPLADVKEAMEAARDVRRTTTDPAALKETLRHKFTNPMLGVYAAHLMMASDTKELALLRELADNLKVVLGDHPDVLSLYLWMDKAAGSPPFLSPPMLRTSWSVLVNRSLPRTDVVPRGSYSARIGDRIWGSGAWLTWLRPERREEESSPGPDDVVAESFGRKLMSSLLVSLGKKSAVASISQGTLDWVRIRLAQEGSAAALVEKESEAKKLTSLERTLFAYIVNVVQQQVHIEELAADKDRKGKLGALAPYYRMVLKSDLYKRASASAIDFISKEKLVSQLGMPEASIMDAMEGLTRKLGQ